MAIAKFKNIMVQNISSASPSTPLSPESSPGAARWPSSLFDNEGASKLDRLLRHSRADGQGQPGQRDRGAELCSTRPPPATTWTQLAPPATHRHPRAAPRPTWGLWWRSVSSTASSSISSIPWSSSISWSWSSSISWSWSGGRGGDPTSVAGGVDSPAATGDNDMIMIIFMTMWWLKLWWWFVMVCFLWWWGWGW